MEYVLMDTIIFEGKRRINWDAVEEYLKRFAGKTYTVLLYDDKIKINANFADEYTGSKYTHKLMGNLARIKANIVQIIPRLIETAVNKRWYENREEKHKYDAKLGWYRYDSYFNVNIGSDVNGKNYKATLVVRKNDYGNYLHDIIDIKKEAGNPQES